jgi:hypothetical protein
MPTVPIPRRSTPTRLIDSDFQPGDANTVLMAGNDLAIALTGLVHDHVNSYGTWADSASVVENLDRLHHVLDDLGTVTWRTRRDLKRVELRIRRRIARRRAALRDSTTRRDRRS